VSNILPFTLSKAQLISTINNIAENCDSWLSQLELAAPAEVMQRREYMHGFKCSIKALIGLFTKYRLTETEDIYIFEGIRNKEYMKAFNSNSIVIIGSHIEKEYAMLHGYGFCRSFPIDSSIQTKISRKWNYPAAKQVMLWSMMLSRFKRVILFLYEDTQPLGAFFVSLGRLRPSTITSVCIQHGYYAKTYYPIRNEGGLCDINFVMSLQQVELIGANASRTYEIGLQYTASAKPYEGILYVILVGTGMVADGTDYYQRSISAYSCIQDMLANVKNVEVIYRPHPNEIDNGKTLCYLRSKFSLIDEVDKLVRLNGPRSIFIGTISTLLYEAGVAGHHIAHLKLGDGVPAFQFDFGFEESEIELFLRWVLGIKNNNMLDYTISSVGQLTPLERFKLALHKSKLVNQDESSNLY